MKCLADVIASETNPELHPCWAQHKKKGYGNTAALDREAPADRSI